LDTLEDRVEANTSDGWFKTSHWSVVLEAANGDGTRGSGALAQLCQTYWPPIYGYTRRLGHSPEDAKDLTQKFFARLLEKRFLKAADRDKGTFRSFLLVA
jgi:DNA-directed RNA polymerase specialized sigma24 family protein